MEIVITNDQSAYRQASQVYAQICEQSEGCREESLRLRPKRFEAYAKKKEAAENLLMGVQGHFRSALVQVGLWDLYQSLISGTDSDDSTLFRLADETLKWKP